jgi:hypothetical protein
VRPIDMHINQVFREFQLNVSIWKNNGASSSELVLCSLFPCEK